MNNYNFNQPTVLFRSSTPTGIIQYKINYSERHKIAYNRTQSKFDLLSY
jgi:hypothetical protein